ncbi:MULTISPECIES: adenylyl-sulfate kinase [unclassified Rhizobacter]|uniref:adenylyl-sulfate kinase n=1 Tax=unclassified Rhizobacter TaxID=2640088 RepID=UPI0009EB815C|nr:MULTISPECIES: adenylyl-sulfate kinase [unclassified Rhizobacter]
MTPSTHSLVRARPCHVDADAPAVARGATCLNVVKHPSLVSATERHTLLRQQPATVWLTGLSGAGKSTLAYAVERRLHAQGHLGFVLDGDNIRHHLSSDLGFSPAERRENIRRVAEVAALMNDAGLIVFTALISPRQEDREQARSIIGDARFIEVHVSTALAVCEARDPKGLYEKARAGAIPHFTGVSAPYETPQSPALRIDTDLHSPDQSAEKLMDFLVGRCAIVS